MTDQDTNKKATPYTVKLRSAEAERDTWKARAEESAVRNDELQAAKENLEVSRQTVAEERMSRDVWKARAEKAESDLALLRTAVVPVVQASRTTTDRAIESKIRFDPNTKPRPDLIPAGALLSVGAVLAWAEARPDAVPERWRSVDTRGHLASAMRHVLEHLRGVELDPESRMPHLAHAGARVLYALEQMGARIATDVNAADERPVPSDDRPAALSAYNVQELVDVRSEGTWVRARVETAASLSVRVLEGGYRVTVEDPCSIRGVEQGSFRIPRPWLSLYRSGERVEFDAPCKGFVPAQVEGFTLTQDGRAVLQLRLDNGGSITTEDPDRVRPTFVGLGGLP